MFREDKKKILFIVQELESANGTCTMNVAEELQNRGWGVDILSYRIENSCFDRRSINIIEIRPKLWRALKQKCSNRNMSAFLDMMYKAQIAATIFMWPWNSPWFSVKLYKKAAGLHAVCKYDCIVPVYTQLDSLIAGFLLKKRYRDLKVIPYFLDSLSAGSTPKLLSGGTKIKKGLFWENKLLKHMDGIVYMKSSEVHHMKYSTGEKYFEKAVFLDIPMLKIREDRSFDISMNKNEDHAERVIKKSEKGQITVTYVGTLPLSVRNPKYAIKILDSIESIKLVLNIVGEDKETGCLNSVCADNLKINCVGKVSHEKALGYIKKADVLLNIGNNVSGMVPSKIFEYISYYKPVLSFAPIAEEPSIPYLEKYPAACIVYEYDDFEKNVRRVQKFINHLPECKIMGDELKKMYYLNTPGCYADYIDSKV